MIWAKFWISQTRASALGHATNAPQRVQITEEPSCSENHPKKPLHWSWSCSLMFILCSILVVQSSNHYSVTICDYRSVQSRAGKQFSMPPRSAWALLRGPWQTWHFESLNHLTGIQTSQTLCLKDLAPKFKKTNVSNFAPLSQLNYQFWREIWLNWGGRSISATSTETNVCSGLSAKMPPRSRMARQICEEKIVYDIFG